MRQGPDFIVCGEALVDVFMAPGSSSAMPLDTCVGGSPFNVAVGLARLAQSVAFFGALSRDAYGDVLAGTLVAEGVDTSTVLRTAAPTTLVTVRLDRHGVPSYSVAGQEGAEHQLNREALDLVPAGARALHLGSYTTVAEPIAGTLRSLVERERGRLLVAYDPNVRLVRVPDRGAWRRSVDWMLTRTDLLKVSEDDLRLLAPETTPETFAAAALEAGVALVVVTRGSQGAAAWTRNARADRPAAPAQVVDTVGAGDTFQAALLAWFAEHGALERARLAALTATGIGDALGFATRAAAITCSRRGADLPRRAELR